MIIIRTLTVCITAIIALFIFTPTVSAFGEISGSEGGPPSSEVLEYFQQKTDKDTQFDQRPVIAAGILSLITLLLAIVHLKRTKNKLNYTYHPRPFSFLTREHNSPYLRNLRRSELLGKIDEQIVRFYSRHQRLPSILEANSIIRKYRDPLQNRPSNLSSLNYGFNYTNNSTNPENTPQNTAIQYTIWCVMEAEQSGKPDTINQVSKEMTSAGT